MAASKVAGAGAVVALVITQDCIIPDFRLTTLAGQPAAVLTLVLKAPEPADFKGHHILPRFSFSS